MKINPLSISGAWEMTPVQHGDPRGLFLEWFSVEPFVEAVGHPLRLAQANTSVSARGVVRGVHYADVPPGQAKYLTCTHGALLDIIVDIRVGSPTFGRWEAVLLDDTDRRVVYVSEGLGHGFCALTDNATLTYLCSEPFNPQREHVVHPLDPDLAIEWPVEAPQLSVRDAAGPTLAEALRDGRLPDYAACQEYVDSLRAQ
jgi:dTDP-4-dehydrorhamnose 3,5-epimerase